jgi:phosphoglycerol transferase MdoB-like AlkP superfamily enzyme
LNCIDFGLFSFTGKRSGTEIFTIMGFGKDFINTLPKMLADFWYLLLIFFFIVFVLTRLYPRLNKIYKRETKHPVVLTIFLFLLFSGLAFIGFRGGIQYKPLNILSASRYGTGKTTALILNTPFTVIKTYSKNRLEEFHWMTDSEAKQITPVYKKPNQVNFFTPLNVVLIILEGFGKEYIGSLNSYKGYTPFLDSLIEESLVFTNAYANGKRSIEGIPAIVAGIPALMTDPFISSAYSGNVITSLPGILKVKGYTSAFFHGGTNGTMGFDNFSKLAGYDYYFGRTEYNNDADFDGSWGIYDEPFLIRTATEISKMKSPFFATVFTLSSHHPYKIPEKIAGQFPKGTLPIHQSIGYADYSLKMFFEKVVEQPWFDNTLFVLTADHTAISEYPFYMSSLGMFATPVIYFSADDSKLRGKNNVTTQHIDILPSIADYLGYDLKYFAFGVSVFDSTENHYAINYTNETFQLIQDDHSFILDTVGKNSLYNFVEDSLLKNNLAGKDPALEKKMELKLKSVIQNFNQAIIQNQMR